MMPLFHIYLFITIPIAIAFAFNSTDDYSIACTNSYTLGNNERILALDTLSNTSMIVVAFNAATNIASTQIINPTTGKTQTSLLPIDNPKKLRYSLGCDPGMVFIYPQVIITTFPNQTYSISITFNDIQNDPTPSVMQRLFTYNQTTIYPLTDWFISFTDTKDINWYDAPVRLEMINDYMINDLWINRTTIHSGKYRNILQFTIINASNGHLFIPSDDHTMFVHATETTTMDTFNINQCYDKNSQLNRWTIMYTQEDSADYHQSFGIVYEYNDGIIQNITDLISLHDIDFEGACSGASCLSVDNGSRIIICFPYVEPLCGIYDGNTLKRIGQEQTLDITWDSVLGGWILVRNDNKTYLVMCQLQFLDNLGCGLVDIEDNFNVILNDIPVFPIKCCDWHLDFMGITDETFIISATNLDNNNIDASKLHVCQVTFV
eukprot:69840_1